MNKVGAWLFASFFLLSAGCARPVPDLWPPQPGAPSHVIVVSLDTWHAMIAVSRTSAEVDAQSVEPHSWLYEEWGFAERDWYLEGRQGISGTFRTLFWPSPGIVEIGHYNQLWSERTPQPPVEQFTFHLTERGFRRLRHYLESTVEKSAPILTTGRSQFYSATRSYHLFHHCHHYSASALREAGLPISVFWAFNRGSFASQLRRAERMANELRKAPR